jgi:molecular chaperone HscA
METTKNFLLKNEDLLEAEEIASTNEALKKLQQLIMSGNSDQIHHAIEQLNSISRPYAERVMDKAIAIALKNKPIL